MNSRSSLPPNKRRLHLRAVPPCARSQLPPPSPFRDWQEWCIHQRHSLPNRPRSPWVRSRSLRCLRPPHPALVPDPSAGSQSYLPTAPTVQAAPNPLHAPPAQHMPAQPQRREQQKIGMHAYASEASAVVWTADTPAVLNVESPASRKDRSARTIPRASRGSAHLL